MNGNQIIGTFSLSYRISHRVDTEISLSRPESGVQAFLVKLFPKVMAQLPGCEIVKYNIQTVNSGESKTFYPHEVLTPMGSDLLVELKSNSGTTLYSKQYTYDEFLAIFVRINGSSYWIGN